MWAALGPCITGHRSFAVVDVPGGLGRCRSLLLLGRVLVGGCSSVDGGKRALSRRLAHSAGGAAAPVDDLGFVDLEAVVVVGGEAGHLADGAVDVERGAAAAADQVVVVVADPVLVAGGATRPAGSGGRGSCRPARRACRRPPGARSSRSSARTSSASSSAVAWERADTARMMASRWAVTCTPCRRSSCSGPSFTKPSRSQILDCVQYLITSMDVDGYPVRRSPVIPVR